ncbi:MAG: hypothetical protein R3F13_03890 [Prosthecobacter sp.]
MNHQNTPDTEYEFKAVQGLIRLKRFEQPEEDFTENFLREFHQRQRAEMLKQSAFSLLAERVGTWWNNLLVPKWGLAAATAAVCVMGAWMASQNHEATVVTSVPAIPVIEEKPFIPKMDLSDLPMANITDRGNSKLEESLLRKHLEMRPAIESTVSPLPASGTWQVPSQQNAVPATHNGVDGGLGR